MKKLLIALLLLPVIGSAAEMTVEQAEAVKVNALVEMTSTIEHNGPALGVTEKGMKNPTAVALQFGGMLHDVVAQGLSQGATCDQVKTVINNGPVATMQKEGSKLAGGASFALALSEYAAADCITTRARMEAAK